MIYIESNTSSPADNLAMETWLFDHCAGQDVLYLWRNRPCVILGRNQCAAQEVDLPLAQSLGVPVLRRQTGGGAVYHDLGNLNFTFLTDDPGTDRPYETFLQPLVALLRRQGIQACFNGRNDLCVAGRKFSGSAARVRRGRLLHHGTLLVDTDLERMQRLLTPDAAKLRRNGVASVRSRVVNLSQLAPALTTESLTALIRGAFAAEPWQLPPEASAQIRSIREEYFANPAWNLAK